MHLHSPLPPLNPPLTFIDILVCLKYSNIEISPSSILTRSENEARVYCTNSRLTAVAVPEGTGWGADPTVQHLAGAGEGSTVPGEDIALGVGIARGVGIGRQVAGTGEAAHLDLWEIIIIGHT